MNTFKRCIVLLVSVLLVVGMLMPLMLMTGATRIVLKVLRYTTNKLIADVQELLNWGISKR